MSGAVLEAWRNAPSWQRATLIASLLMLDAGLGLRHAAGLICWAGLFEGNDLQWILLIFEFFAGLLVLLRMLFSELRGGLRVGAMVGTPPVFFLSLLLIAHLLFTRLEEGQLFTFNLASIGMSGLYWAAAYLCIAVGLTLTYRVQGYGNFAQGEFMLLGCYIALTLQHATRWAAESVAEGDGVLTWELLVTAMVAAFLITGLIGVLIDVLVYRRFRRKGASYQTMMIASLGVSMILRALLYLRYTAQSSFFMPDRDWRLSTSHHDVPTRIIRLRLGELGEGQVWWEWVTDANDYGFTYGKTLLVCTVFGAVLLLMALLRYSSLGRRMRATADNPDLAAASGIHIERIQLSSAFLSAGISGLGGVPFAIVARFYPETGLSLLLPAFAVIVLGTIGSIWGAMIGALLIGFVRAASEPLLSAFGQPLDRPSYSELGEIMPFIFLVAVLIVMPKGIGDAMEQARIRRRRNRVGSADIPHWRQRMETGFRRLESGLTKLMIPLETLLMSFIAVLDLSCEAIGWGWRWLCETLRTMGRRIRERLGDRLQSLQTRCETLKTQLDARAPALHRYGRESRSGSWMMWCGLMLLLGWILLDLPSVNAFTKSMQVSLVLVNLAIFALMALSLNMHTGMTGMSNFGVIFFAGAAAVVCGLLSAPTEFNGYGWSFWRAGLVGLLVAGAFGWLLAYPTARLRHDYFAIVTISLGEVLRVLLKSDPLLRAGTSTSAINILNYELPFKDWWSETGAAWFGDLFGLGKDAPYQMLLAMVGLTICLVVWALLSQLYASPWGRILRAIREDEEVAQHHGHNVLRHKAASLALGAAIAGLGGLLLAWRNAAITPDDINPARTTFLVWAAFIIGGRANDRGMFVGAFIIVLMDITFNNLGTARGISDHALHETVLALDERFTAIIDGLTGILWSEGSVVEAFGTGEIIANLAYVKLGLVGLVILLSLMFFEKGLVPEVPHRPARPMAEAIADGGECE